MENSRSNDPLDRAIQRARDLDTRPWNVFFVPQDMKDLSLPGGENIASMAFVELSPHELHMVVKLSTDASQIGQNQILASLVAINCDEMGTGGKRISSADGSADKVIAKMHPRIFELALSAYNSLHENTREERLNFLKSRKVVATG